VIDMCPKKTVYKIQIFECIAGCTCKFAN